MNDDCAAPEVGTDIWAAKNRGELCFVYDCQEPDPRSPVIWKCPSCGERLEILYCPSHGAKMTAMAIELDHPGNLGGSDSWEDAGPWRHRGSIQMSSASAR